MSAGEVEDLISARQKAENERRKWQLQLIWNLGQLDSFAFNDPEKYPTLEKAFPSAFGMQQTGWMVIKARMSAYAKSKNAARHRAGEKMTVEELQVLITANTKDFNAKIDKANKRLGSLEQQATRTGAGVGKLFTGIKTTAAVAVIREVVSEVKKLTDAYAENEAAQMGLSSILTAQGKDLNAAKAWLKSYTKDGLIPMMDAYTAYKRLAAAGYSDEQTQSILTNLKDSAAFNRQGSMTMGEAIKSAAEGIKNENSILVDNAGVTKTCPLYGTNTRHR